MLWGPEGGRVGVSVAQMLAAASIKVMDALFGFLARNDAEWTKQELLGRTWRRDWAMHDFREFLKIEDLRKFGRASNKMEDRMLGVEKTFEKRGEDLCGVRGLVFVRPVRGWCVVGVRVGCPWGSMGAHGYPT